jgi:hypothetical protein
MRQIETWILVETSKRSYCVRAGQQVPWMRGEKVVRMEIVCGCGQCDAS